MSKFSLSILCLIAIGSSLSYAQRDGRYRPYTTVATKKPLYPALGRYNPNKNDGKYYPSDAGRYRGVDDGKYQANDAGKYTDQGNYYKPEKKIKTSNVGREKVIGRNRNVGSRFDPRTGLLKKTKTTKVSASGSATIPKRPRGKGTSIGDNNFEIVYLLSEEEKDGYHYIYETENGILAEEEGHIVELSTGQGLRAKGFFEYTGDDGSLYRVDYAADDAGFVPQGAHLHPTPPHVIKLLEYLAKNAKK